LLIYRLRMVPWAETCVDIVRPINSIMHRDMWQLISILFDGKWSSVYSKFMFLRSVFLTVYLWNFIKLLC
jgi:hypothetical protein